MRGVCGSQGADPNFMNAAGDLTLFWCVTPPCPVCGLHPPPENARSCTHCTRPLLHATDARHRVAMTRLCWSARMSNTLAFRFGVCPVSHTLHERTGGGEGLTWSSAWRRVHRKPTPRWGWHSATLDASISMPSELWQGDASRRVSTTLAIGTRVPVALVRESRITESCFFLALLASLAESTKRLDGAPFWDESRGIDGGIEIIKVLYEYGADLDARTPKDWTPLSYAKACGKYGLSYEKGIYPEDVLKYYGASEYGSGPPALGTRSPRESYDPEADNFSRMRGSYQNVPPAP